VRREFRFSIGLELIKNVYLSVTSISSYSFESRRLKNGRDNLHINATKYTDQFFDIISGA